MDRLDMCSKISSLVKWFPTSFTFEFFNTFMNGLGVFFQRIILSEWFSTRVTFEISWPTWIVLMCLCRTCEWEKDLQQESHLKSLRPSWMVLMWLFRFWTPVYDFPQESHLKSLWPSWTVLMCFLIILPTWGKFYHKSHILYWDYESKN